jgi:large subunit ribosomal protein L23
MKNNIIVKPHITEKSFDMANSLNKYVFLVEGKMNKIEVKKYVEKEYKVKVLNVSSITQPGKKRTDWKTNRKFRKSDKKKYIVELKKGDKINEFLNK